MLAVIAKLTVAEGKEEAFEEVMLGLAAQVRENEPGNRLYELCKDEDGKAAGGGFKGLMAGPPEIQRLQVVGGADK